MCSLASPQKPPSWKCQWSTLDSTARCCMELFCLCCLSCPPLLAQPALGDVDSSPGTGMDWDRGSQGGSAWCCLPPLHLFSFLMECVSADLAATSQAFWLPPNFFFMQFINFLSPQELFFVGFSPPVHPVALSPIVTLSWALQQLPASLCVPSSVHLHISFAIPWISLPFRPLKIISLITEVSSWSWHLTRNQSILATPFSIEFSPRGSLL